MCDCVCVHGNQEGKRNTENGGGGAEIKTDNNNDMEVQAIHDSWSSWLWTIWVVTMVVRPSNRSDFVGTVLIWVLMYPESHLTCKQDVKCPTFLARQRN